MDTTGNSLPSPSCPDAKKRRVCYYYDAAISNFNYGDDHCMVPRRVAMTHGLVSSYGMLGRMRRLRTRPATEDDLLAFHDRDYVRFLLEVTPQNIVGNEDMRSRAKAHGISGGGKQYDNPVMEGLSEYCLRYTGGSIAAARALVDGASDIAVNWSGGMHHACASRASGFCYVNDIVLAIKELHNRFTRVLYVDIDVHHGDGVEGAFFRSNRTMTVSFHQGDNMFPWTGGISSIGKGEGKYHSLNVPMNAGMDDEGYHRLFKPIMSRVMSVYQPEAIVLQCGADSLCGDRLGRLNLSVRGHAQCVEFLRSFNVPLLLLGGGGYTTNHVASCWCYETAVAIGMDISNDIPYHGYEHYYESQGYKLHYTTSNMKNQNKDNDIAHIEQTIFKYLFKIEAAPSISFQERCGRMGMDNNYDSSLYDDDSNEEEDPIERLYRLCGETDVKNFELENDMFQ